MEQVIIERDNGKAISFKGKLLAKVSSSPNIAMGSSYSGYTGTWQILKLYKTEKGSYVCQRINRTQWQGSRDTYEAAICKHDLEIYDFFGYDWLAKELYIEADVNNFEVVD